MLCTLDYAHINASSYFTDGSVRLLLFIFFQLFLLIRGLCLNWQIRYISYPFVRAIFRIAENLMRKYDIPEHTVYSITWFACVDSFL